MDNILALHNDLRSKRYRHGSYHAFNIADPKPRAIHKATVSDRLLHHALHRRLYPFFDRTFIADSYSCRKGKGTHKALNRFRAFANQVSKNHTRTVWVLKCDIRKFFASIDHVTLARILHAYIPDKDVVRLLSEIIGSFQATRASIGLPLGNLTSQLFANIYLNGLDQFMKHKCKAKYYVRYADDFVILSRDKEWLLSLMPRMRAFLSEELRLMLHPRKVSIRTFASGVDFLGWVHFPCHRVLRTATKQRMVRRIWRSRNPESVHSYLGLLRHGNTYKLRQHLFGSGIKISS